MKILFLSENYFPNVSGVPVVVRYLAEGLANLGHQVSIATSNFKNCPEKEVIGGVTVYRFNLIKDHINRYRGDIDKYIEFVLFFKCDILILECVMCVTTDLITPYLGKIEAKTILHSHGISGLRLKPFEKKKDILHTIANTYHWAYYSYYFKYVFPKYVKRLDRIICLSKVDDTISYCKQYGKDVEILGNAVEDVFLLPTKDTVQEDLVKLGASYFLSVAYYNQIKNQINILKEFYKSGIKEYAMVFIGPSENEYYYRLLEVNKELINQYGERKILFLTHVDRSFIPDIIGNAKLYIVGSTIEQFSISVIEAMSKGIPFISTNVGNAKILPGGVTIDSIDHMHTVMKNLIDDNERYSKLSKNGIEYVKKFCVRERVISKLEAIILNSL